MKLQDYDTSTRYQARVVRSERIDAQDSRREIREIILEVDSDFHILPGQNLGVIVPAEASESGEPHFRLYSVADLPEATSDARRLHIYVKRCQYFDSFTGRTHRGIASNFLCDRQPNDQLTISGPFGPAFEPPSNHRANLILIGAGTGIAPFRAFLKYVYRCHPEFIGQVFLFYGGETGLDLLYGNDCQQDVSLYYDRATFETVQALGEAGEADRYRWSDALQSRAQQLAELLGDPSTFVYLAGLKSIRDELEDVLSEVAGSNQRWCQWKQALIEDDRWVELLY